MARQPAPPPPRYTAFPLPDRAYVPGRDPRSRRLPPPHRPDPREGFEAERWAAHAGYLYGVDLFNLGYWWEAHEVLEDVWRAAGRESPAGRFLQGLIQVAAALLKRVAGHERAARRLARDGLSKLAGAPGPRLGVDVGALRAGLEAYLAGESPSPPVLRLAGAGRGDAGGR